MGLVFLIALSIFTADFFIKKALIPCLSQSFPVIKNVFHITVVANTGAAFGILQRHTFLLVLVSIAFIIFLVLTIRDDTRHSPFLRVVYGLVLGGAASNLYDRLIYGYVVDYLDFRVWPIFNLSDACITTGVVLVILYSLQKTYRGKTLHRS